MRLQKIPGPRYAFVSFFPAIVFTESPISRGERAVTYPDTPKRAGPGPAPRRLAHQIKHTPVKNDGAYHAWVENEISKKLVKTIAP